MKIERITTESVNDVLPLLEAQFVEHDIEVRGAELERTVRGLVAVGGRGIILAAREGGRTIGIAVLSFTWALEMGGLTSWLDELYVVPERRNSGLGTQLLHEAIAAAKNEGCAGVDLEVETEHARAERLYLREGFTRRTRNRFVRTLTRGPPTSNPSLQEKIGGAGEQDDHTDDDARDHP